VKKRRKENLNKKLLPRICTGVEPIMKLYEQYLEYINEGMTSKMIKGYKTYGISPAGKKIRATLHDFDNKDNIDLLRKMQNDYKIGKITKSEFINWYKHFKKHVYTVINHGSHQYIK
jgi:hypothetical protein